MKRLILLLGLLPLSLQAADTSDIEKKVNALLAPGVTVDSIKPSPLEGLFEVIIGSDIIYVSADGHYMLNGDLVNITTQENLTENRRNGIRKALLDAVDEDEMIVYGPDSAPHTITVFTDIDCGYCRKLHRELDSYIKLGFKVRYLAYPRAGLGSESYNKAVSVWCAKDRQQALTEAKGGDNPPRRSCENPVASHMALGQKFGVRGTPSIVLEDGRMLPGYVPAGRLKQALTQGN
ncbi:MAG: DsbC family protein [Gammaproteobacteria bacterium]|nr:DsbC family protein [Gammaproteobacteria bacterium]